MLKRIISISALVLMMGNAASVWGQENAAVPTSPAIYKTDFSQPNGLAGWTGAGVLETDPVKGPCLNVTRTGEAKDIAVSSRTIPCAKYRGCLLLVSADVQCKNVQASAPDSQSTVTHETIQADRHAVKFMVTAGGEAYQAAVAGGSFGWKPVACRVFVPWNATTLTISLGLNAGVTGTACFDDVKIQIRQKNAFPRGKVPMGTWTLPRSRGAMVDPRALKEEDYQVLGGQWKANLVRWQFLGAPPYNSPADDAAYDAWLNGEIKRLDDMLPVLRKYGIRAVIAMFGAPGGGGGWEGSPLYTNPACQKRLIEAWQTLAKHYKGVDGIYGYDMVNEPNDILGLDNVGYDTVPGDVYNWWELADRTARAIRKIDPDTPIVMEPSPGGVPYGFIRFKPLNVPNVIYSPHMYMPYQYTHQHVFPCFSDTLRYPGFQWGGQTWDRNRIRAELQHVVDFQKQWGARIYVGEFSAVRWAPGAYDYIKDIVDVLEENGWDWTYHAFREHPCWSVEHDENKDNPTLRNTNRQELLMKLYEKNPQP